MIKVKKSNSGYHVTHTGKNGEPLNAGEVLATKAAAFKQILADARENFPGCRTVVFYDCTSQRKGKVKMVWQITSDGKKVHKKPIRD